MEFLIHDEAWLIDDTLSRNSSLPEDISIIGRQRAFYRNGFLAVRAKTPPRRADIGA